MKKNAIYMLPILALLTVGFGSCSKHEVPKSTLGFDVADMSVKESDGTIASFNPLIQTGGVGQNVTIAITLDRAVAETSVIAITVEGTASSTTTSKAVNDYSFVSDDKNIIINKGESSAEIVLTVFEDNSFEIDNANNTFETVIIKMTSVVSGTAIIGPNDTFTLSITEDDAVLFLDWDAGDGTIGDVDMDTYLLDNSGNIVNGSAGINSAQNNYEAFTIPAGYPSIAYGATYTYYSGTSDDLKFLVSMYNLGGTLNGGTYADITSSNAIQFEGNYTLANINPFDGSGGGTDPLVAQTVTKSGYNYTLSQITPLSSGSRLGGHSSINGSSALTPIKIEREEANRIMSLYHR